MTSNIGASTSAKNQKLGFSIGDDSGLSYDEMKSRITGELNKVFRPELLNRIGEAIDITIIPCTMSAEDVVTVPPTEPVAESDESSDA